MPRVAGLVTVLNLFSWWDFTDDDNISFSDMKNLIGEALCNICQESFSTTITGKS